MTTPHFGRKLLAGLMALCLLIPAAALPTGAADASTAAPAVTATATATVTLGNTEPTLNFSTSGTAPVGTVDAARIIELATGTAPTAEEAAYLASVGMTAVFSQTPTADLATVTAEGRALTFKAKATSYTAQNGATVRWAPVSITLEGKTQPLDAAKGYTATFADLANHKAYTATLTYRAGLELPAATVNAVLNRAITDVRNAGAAQSSYEAQLAAYLRADSDFQAALDTYTAQYAAYQAYVKAQTTYTAELAAYEDYTKKVDAYKAADALYQAYLKDAASYDARKAEYDAAMAAYPAKQEQYDKYLEYQTALNAAKKKLIAIDSAFIKDSEGHTMYATLMGDTVATVVANRDTLVAAGANAADVDRAGNATTALQSLLTAYRNAGGTAEKFQWYAANYQAVYSNFNQLYNALYSLGHFRPVQAELVNRGKWLRYGQFVCQLYILSYGLNDAEPYDPNYPFKEFTPSSSVDASQHFVDDNSFNPAGTTLPAPMAPVEKPTLPVAPTQPTPVSAPVKTWTEEVAHPGTAPTPVTEPRKPLRTDFPTVRPGAPIVSPELQKMITLTYEGKLTDREKRFTGLSVEVETTYTATTSLDTLPMVTFYDYDKNTVLYTTPAELGAAVAFTGTTPTRPADAAYTYTFRGWVDAAGKPAVLTDIQNDTAVYADYEATLRSYDIIAVTGQGSTTETLAYGTTPTLTAADYTDDKNFYTFTGWSPAVAPVSGNATYTAQYQVTPLSELFFSVRFEVGGQTYAKSFAYGTTPAFTDFETTYTEGNYRYTFTGWSPALAPVQGEAAYTALFDKTPLLPAGDGGTAPAELTSTRTALTVTTDQRIVDATYAVTTAIAEGKELVLSLGGAKLTFSRAAVQTMPQAVYFRLTPAVSRARIAPAPGLIYDFAITDAAGAPVDLRAEVLIELPLEESEQNGGRLHAYVNDTATDLSLQDGIAYLRVSHTGTIALRPYYTVTVKTEGNGTVTADLESAEAGQTVTLTSHIEQGWKLTGLTAAVGGNTEEWALDTADFIMPQGDLTLTATFTEQTYTVTFVVDGTAVSTETYHYGDTVEVPDMSERQIVHVGEKILSFTGWDRTVSLVTEDVTYTAVYVEGTQSETPVSPNGNGVILAALILLPTGIIALTVWLIWRKKQKKARKAANNE